MNRLENLPLVFCYRVSGGMVRGVFSYMGSVSVFCVKAPSDFHTPEVIRHHFTDVIREAIRRGEVD